MLRTSSRVALVVIIVAVALEALLRLVPLPDPYAFRRSSEDRRIHLYLPGWNYYAGRVGETPPFEHTFVTGPLSGVSTTQVAFNVNRFGFPYPESRVARQSDDELRIGVVGGSTVECSALEEGKRWPAVLEQHLSRAIRGRQVTVLNMGVSGQGTRTHLATVAQHAVKLDLDYLVFMLGANDLFRTDSAFNPLERADNFVSQECRCGRSFLFRFQLVRRLYPLYQRARGLEQFAASGKPDEPYFGAYARAHTSRPLLPTATRNIRPVALRDYETNIVSLAALAAAHDITPVFTTQPMLWKPVMTAEEQRVDWLGGFLVRDGQRYRYPPGENARALEMLNRQLLETCSRRSLECIDLEPEVPRTLKYFYDPVHLNEAGAAVVGRRVAEALIGGRRREGK